MDGSQAASQVKDLGNRLDSWKQIAAHLRRSTTTVQRWEVEEGLPSHRHPHAKKGSVFAFTHELDGWLAGRAQGRGGLTSGPAAPGPAAQDARAEEPSG